MNYGEDTENSEELKFNIMAWVGRWGRVLIFHVRDKEKDIGQSACKHYSENRFVVYHSMF